MNSGDRQPGNISFLDVTNVLLANRKVVIGVPLLLAVIVGTATYLSPRKYVASATFVPHVSEGRSGSAASAIARQFGISLAAGQGGESPQVYARLIRSRGILRQAVEAEYGVPDESGVEQRLTLIDHFHLGDGDDRSAAWFKAVEELRKRSSASVDNETGIVQLKVSASHPLLAEQIAQRLITLLNEFNLERRQGHAIEESRFVAGRLEHASSELAAAEEQLLAFLQNNRSFANAPDLRFEHDRLQRNVAVKQDIYTSLALALEQSRLDAARDIPLLAIIDGPAGSAEPLGRGTVVRTFLAFFLSMISVSLVLVVARLAFGQGHSDPTAVEEFRHLLAQARAEVRSPTRLFARRSK